MIDACTYCGHYGYLKRIDGRYLCTQCSRAHLAGRQHRDAGDRSVSKIQERNRG